MDYKQKCEQALERAKVINPGTADYEVAVKIFPELKESEDERIRKALIQYIKYNVSVISGWRKKELIAWLEKQEKVKHTCRNCQTFQDLHQNCPYSPIYQYTDLTDAYKHLDDETHCEFWLEKQVEQKPADKCIGCNNFKGCITCTDGDQYTHITEQKPTEIHLTLNEAAKEYSGKESHPLNNAFIAGAKWQKEQNFTWSEEDERLLSKLQTYVDIECFDRECNGEDLLKWLKSLKPAKWGEEDESMCIRTLGILGKCYMGGLPIKVEEELNWLKSLKERMKGE